MNDKNIDNGYNQQNTENNSSLMANTGALVVFVLDAGGAIPIPGALVKIYPCCAVNGEPIAELISGESGKTDVIYLPTPQISVTDVRKRRPEIQFLYDIVVELEGYHSVTSRNIPVYPQVLSIQPVHMVPTFIIHSENSDLVPDSSDNGGC